MLSAWTRGEVLRGMKGMDMKWEVYNKMTGKARRFETVAQAHRFADGVDRRYGAVICKVYLAD